MAVSNYIQSVIDAARGRPRSTDWFRSKIREFGKPGAMDLIRDGKQKRTPFFGRLNMFFYDPKLKNVLPYYDRFPLIMPIEQYTNGFLGLNFHYLSIPMRLKLLNIIAEYAINAKLDEKTRIRLTWNRIKRNPIVKPTVKRYLMDHVRTPFRRIDADEMMVAVLLPVQRFVRAQETRVYADSRRIANGRNPNDRRG